LQAPDSGTGNGFELGDALRGLAHAFAGGLDAAALLLAVVLVGALALQGLDLGQNTAGDALPVGVVSENG